LDALDAALEASRRCRARCVIGGRRREQNICTPGALEQLEQVIIAHTGRRRTRLREDGADEQTARRAQAGGGANHFVLRNKF
jgi:hypothetical protein